MSIESNNNFETKSLRELESAKINAEAKADKENLKENISQTIINKLNSKDGYKVREYDELGLINKITSKGNRITFNNEADKIWPGDTIRIINGKVFRTHNGEDQIVGVVFSGFKKTETRNKNTLITPKIEKKEEIKKADTSTAEKTEDIIEEKIIPESNKEADTNKNTVIKSKAKNNIDTILHFKEAKASKSIMGNGAEYEAGETLVETDKYNKFEKDLLKKTSDPKLKMIIALSQIWIDGARKEIPKQWSLMGLRKDKEALEEGISGVTEYINEIINISLDKTKDIRDIDNIITSIFKTINEAQTNGEEILDEISDIEGLFKGLNKTNYEERLAKMLELSAGGIITDGNTEKSKEIARDIIINKHFLDAKNSIQNIADIYSLKVEDFTSKPFELNKKQANEIIEEIQDTYKKVKSETDKQSEQIKENFMKQNPDFKGNLTKEINKIIEQASKIQALKIAEEMFVDYKIDSISNDKIVDTYKDLNSNWQKSKEFLAENGAMIALSLVPMGVGFAAVGLAAKGASVVMRGRTLANYGSGVQIAGNSAKGVVFYEGMNLTNNALYQDKFGMDLLNGSMDAKELIKSALFFNIMGIVSKFTTPGATMISAQSMKSISAEIALFTGVDLGVELLFGEEMTMEQFINSLLTGGIMTIMSRGAGNITNGYARGSKIEAKTKTTEQKVDINDKWTTKKPDDFNNLKPKNKVEGVAKDKKTKVDEVKTNNTSREIITEAQKIEKNRAKDGTLTGEYSAYNQKYQDLYKKLDNDGITEGNARGKERRKEIEKLDREIAKEIISKKVEIENIKAKTDSGKKPEEVKVSTKKEEVKEVKKDTKEKAESIKNKETELGKKLNNPENNKKIFDNIRSKLVSNKEFMSMIDKRLSGLPIHIDKLYKIPKWAVHDGKKFRYIPREIGNSIATPFTTPRDFYLNIKNGNYPQAVKNILFSSNDITWKGGLLKVGTYATIPTMAEGIARHNIEGGEINMTFEEFTKEVGKDYLSYMYLGTINSIILEVKGYFTADEKETTK